jgi:hypothetical protein
MGVATFGPTFLQGFGYFDTQVSASFAFGVTLALAGLISTPLGGIIIDRRTRSLAPTDQWGQCSECLRLMTVCELLTTICLVGAVYGGSKMAFLLLLFCGLCFLFLPTACMTMSILLSVPPAVRASAIGFSTVIMHVVGDVPAPVLLGYLKDSWAPNCNSVSACCTSAECMGEAGCCIVDTASTDTHCSAGSVQEAILSPDCGQDVAGLQRTLLVAVLWLLWAVVTWGAALLISESRQRASEGKTSRSSTGEGNGTVELLVKSNSQL